MVGYCVVIILYSGNKIHRHTHNLSLHDPKIYFFFTYSSILSEEIDPYNNYDFIWSVGHG